VISGDEFLCVRSSISKRYRAGASEISTRFGLGSAAVFALPDFALFFLADMWFNLSGSRPSGLQGLRV